MLSSQKPKLIPVAFATSGAKQDIPVASQVSVTPGRASYTDGFPPLTRTPLSAGGIPPYGTDFNGVLNELSAAIRWANAGMGYTYDAAFSTSVGGYPKGAQLTKSTNDGIWLNTVESNTSNPDTGGAGWIDMTGGRLIGEPKVFTASGTYTPSKGTRYVIVEAVGGGGGGGGCSTPSTGMVSAAAGGNAGSYGRGMFAISGNVPVTIGSGGAGGNSSTTPTGATVGSPGGETEFGTFMICPGGLSGLAANSFTIPNICQSIPPKSNPATGANISSIDGESGGNGFALTTGISGKGGGNPLGSGGAPAGSTGGTSVVGNNGTGFGSGGSGAFAGSLASGKNGGDGAPGVVIVWEYT